MNLRLCAIFVAAAILVAEKLPPIDESQSDPSFAAVRAKVIAAARAGNLRAVQDLAEPEVKAELTRENLPEIAKALKLGAARDGGDFIAPYTFARFPHELDALQSAVAIGKSVRVHARPAAAAPIIETLEYDIVQVLNDSGRQWTEVFTPSGKRGWTRSAEIRSPIALRVFFEKKQGRWRITGVFEGD
jgi:hypothetical protein